MSDIIQHRIAQAGMNPEGCSGHSLRSGFATSAAMSGIATWRIRKQTGHASDVMLGRYIRDGESFTDNAAGQYSRLCLVPTTGSQTRLLKVKITGSEFPKAE